MTRLGQRDSPSTPMCDLQFEIAAEKRWGGGRLIFVNDKSARSRNVVGLSRRSMREVLRSLSLSGARKGVTIAFPRAFKIVHFLAPV